ncbi:TetR/AcrR family transcriptional regulator [Agromyces seonyuensis]|uniref:TetR family transcriptional regulator n=1 Tax=Agromyces seonyuensis TaxID=2662446 RepID=A0A6I4NST4_9MICO|nr:TetR/AcrR family transcriptional regulator [Agromyces seonyuensis]MWB97516.1 TetR family transcriptional regulator [Agromyces seonyuensis]
MAETDRATRSRLTRGGILRAAIALADERGLDGLTMRALADGLGVEAMSIYHHLPNKDAILDGAIEEVFAEIAAETLASAPAVPNGAAVTPAPAWDAAVGARILAARRVLLRHPWVPWVLNARGAPGPNAARHVDGIVAAMHDGGLAYDLIHHALHALGSRVYGYVQELSDDGGELPAGALEQLAMVAPNLAAMLAEVVHDDPDSTLGWCDDQTEFEFGLDLLLDGLVRRAADPSLPPVE